MKRYNVQIVMVTKIAIWRDRLITKQKMENVCQGSERGILSVNDDLETLFENIQFGEEPDEKVHFYFLPKLTEDELQLVERKDENFMQTFNLFEGALDDMGASESDSKYVYGFGYRKTFTITN